MAAAISIAAPRLARGAEPDDPRPVDLTGPADASVPGIRPWRRVELDKAGGSWCVLGDVDGDGEVEIISAQTAGESNRHFTSAVSVQKLDGSPLWRWRAEGVGRDDSRRELAYDVPCQVHDWNDDGRAEVVLLTRTPAGRSELRVLDGPDGRLMDRFDIPDHATDCLCFADLRGVGQASDVIVKTRYGRAWA